MYTIGEFSKIAHVSTRMLRYYESLGLIMPKITGSENGYRYYDASQLSTIYEIQRLQNCGVKLKEIPNLLSKTSAEKYQCYLENYQKILLVLMSYLPAYMLLLYTLDLMKLFILLMKHLEIG